MKKLQHSRRDGEIKNDDMIDRILIGEDEYGLIA